VEGEIPENLLLRSQVNELIKLAAGSGVPPAAIEFSRDLAKPVLYVQMPLRLAVRGTEFFFEIDYDPGKRGGRQYKASRFPAGSPRTEVDLTPFWSTVVEYFGYWLRTVGRELGEPEPWLLLTGADALLAGVPLAQAAAETFDDRELGELRKFLGTVREFVASEGRATPSQLSEIDERLAYLEEQARKQDKRAWAFTAIGVVVTIAVGSLLSPEQAHKLFGLTAEFLRGVLTKLLE
jgi:hypothetical protein